MYQCPSCERETISFLRKWWSSSAAPATCSNCGSRWANSYIREKLLALNIPNLALQPAIFIDDWGKWYEDYWYLTFLSTFHCWNRKTSDLGEKVKVVDEYVYTIYRVGLDDAVMKATPLEQRLLFQLDTLPGLVLAHKSIAGIFRVSGDSGALVVSLADYPYRP